MTVLPARPFYLVRHGQTDANVAQLISGGCEATLTDEGRRLADHLGDHMDQVLPAPVLIIHSDRTRTRETANLLNKKLNLPTETHVGMDEHNFGDWIGKPVNPFFHRVHAGETPPGGESVPVFAARVGRVMKPLLETKPGPLLFVAHNGTFRAFAHLYGLPVWSVTNGILHYFEPVEGKFPWRVWKWTPENGKMRREQVIFESTDHT